MQRHEIVDRLVALQVERKFMISMVSKQTNAAGAFVRLQIGWSPDAEDAAAIKVRAARIVAAALNAKPFQEDDAEIGGRLLPTLSAVALGISPFEKGRASAELAMKKLVRQLDAYAWAKDVKGFGEIGLAVLVAEAGDLASYPNPAKKRLGLAPLNGKAMSTWRRSGGLTAEDWTVAGYAPRRRAEIHACIADSMAKHQLVSAEKSGTTYGAPVGPYGETYVKRRERTAVTHPEWTKAHARMDALRIMTKHLVLDLWSEWRRPTKHMTPDCALAAADIPASARLLSETHLQGAI